ncbi:unnamed protein product [Anisakis simplex]|uniref:Serum amyloid A protein n=1 Tax=Anisakis simplex TaxID=6269 RepID=A0A0M3JEU1_ANISI|nr:unnamed protein product [Anisakis simplex]
MNFGKRALGPNMRFLGDLYDDYRQKRDFDRDFMHFGKRSAADRWPYQGADKRDEAFSRDFLSFGKRFDSCSDRIHRNLPF